MFRAKLRLRKPSKARENARMGTRATFRANDALPEGSFLPKTAPDTDTTSPPAQMMEDLGDPTCVDTAFRHAYNQLSAMSPANIALVIPLADARRSRKSGTKAANLSKLIAARFAVPEGFVISSDAYRAHLLAGGAREAASAPAEAEDRERIRAAILSQPIPEDIRETVERAYERLSGQLGERDPKVAVRSSSVEGDVCVGGFTGAYESYLNVAGLEAVNVAVKRVWASLWGGKAAAYRARFGVSAEPAMAVVVQQMVDADCTGTAFTADPVTGDPHKVLISCASRAHEAAPLGAADLSHYTVDLTDLAVRQHRDDSRPLLDNDLVQLIAEKALLADDAISGRVEMEWAHDGERLWILQARPIRDLAPYFPVSWTNESDADAEWFSVTAQPVSHFARSCLWRATSGLSSAFPPTSGARKSKPINGYLYKSARPIRDPKTRSAAGRGQKKEIAVALRLLRDWEQEVEPDLRSRSSRIIGSDLSRADHADLLRDLSDAADTVLLAVHWLELARRLGARFPALLREMLPQDECLYRKLLAGMPDTTIMRDARLQELGERFAAAEKSGKLTDETWWPAYKRDVDAFARDYGYSFKDAGEMYDIALWQSWVEDSDVVFRMISAIARRGKRPTLVTVHCAAQEGAERAADSAPEILGLGGRQRHRFRTLAFLARTWLTAKNDTEHVYALACTALRLVLMQLGRRLCESGMIGGPDDVFQLTLDELLAAPADVSGGDRAAFASLIAARKHQLWLERRLVAPHTLPLEEGGEARAEPDHRGENRLKGDPVSPGVAEGRARVVDDFNDAADLGNGDILIVKTSALAWTPLLAAAGAFVAQQGGELSCEAIVAREYGIPAVVNCEGIASAVKAGQRITVNGSEGVVELTSRA